MQETPTPEMTDQQSFEHDTQGETLIGLAVKYNITPEAIRKFNNLTTNEIYYLKTIVIPDKSSYDNKPEQLNQNSLYKMFMVEYMMSNILDPADRSAKVAKYYLEVVDWDLDQAIVEYNQDKSFDK